jgi:hypothetical protein
VIDEDTNHPSVLQALAAQWVVDAVPAYNALVEHVQTLPLQLPEQGASPSATLLQAACAIM